MRIRKKFLELTKQTYPHGTEAQLEKFLPDGYQTDCFGNYYLQVGEFTSTMFACHLDTYGKEQRQIKHVFKNNFIMTDGQTNLGADDKAGMIVLLYMIQEKIPGLYYFFVGEEVGCIGSKKVADFAKSESFESIRLKNITKVISFDRRGTSSIITEQSFNECCSDNFANELAYRLNGVGNGLVMRPDNTGASTDSAQFMELIPECTNISVGYYDEHTVSERLDIQYLYRLCHAVTEIDWETLPVERVPQPKWSYYNSSKLTGLDDWDAPFDNSANIYSGTNFRYRAPNSAQNFIDEFDTRFYTFQIDPIDGRRKMAYISKSWVYHEELLITQSLQKVEKDIDRIKWDGTSCWIYKNDKTLPTYYGGRNDMAHYLSNFGYIPSQHLFFEDAFRRELSHYPPGKIHSQRQSDFIY